MGYLKGWWPSLRGLNQQIGDVCAHQLACTWVMCCIILHNLIICFEQGINESDPWYEAILAEGWGAELEEVDLDDAIDTDEPGIEGVNESPGQQKCRELREALEAALVQAAFDLM